MKQLARGVASDFYSARRGRWLKSLVIACVVIGAVLLYLLSRASGDTATLSGYYPLLLVLNMIMALGLLALVGYQLAVLRRKLKARVFGTKLTVRLLWMFAAMAVVPGVLVYGVSVQFLTKSIESWFDVRVDNALEGGLELGRNALDNLRQDVLRQSESMATSLADGDPLQNVTALHSLREQLGIQQATLLSPRGAPIAFSSADRSDIAPDLPSAAVLRQVRQQQPYSVIEAVPDKGLFIRVVVPVNTLSVSEDIRVLQVLQNVPARLARDAETVEAVYRDYQELSLSRRGLGRIYGLTLTLTLLLALFSALSVAFLLSDRLSAPLSVLAEGTRAIAKGDFSQMQPVHSRDELGSLTRSFNSMTRQLAETRNVVEQKQQQLEAAKVYLESILSHLSSGVLAFDTHMYLRTANLRASEILGHDMLAVRGLNLLDGISLLAPLRGFSLALSQQFHQAGVKEWQTQLQHDTAAGMRTLLVRGTQLPSQFEGGYVAVFDDITELMQAQREAAWGEVARRLAHEIKNPLTPIQLSAERIERKLGAKLEASDAEMLHHATRTIVNQVSALKHMVNAFSDYARSAPMNWKALDLNALVRDVLTLYEAANIHIATELAQALPTICADATQLRQVIHNLLKNAQDAVIQLPDPKIEVRTSMTVDDSVQLEICDNGSGIADSLLPRIFEPYVTGKSKGTGLGLAIVKKIIDEHHAAVQIENRPSGGVRVAITFPRVTRT